MPYNIPKEHGGDSKENMAKMERCVKRVMSDGRSKSSAIAICMSSMFGPKGKGTRGK